MRQLRIAETEKYAHVTFFFNGGTEAALAGEDRILVPSPKVATYDLAPEMAAPEVTERLEVAIASDAYDFIVVNYANPDMVGHTGDLDAAVRAIETVDACLGRIEGAVVEAGGALIVTSDHGNAECMREPNTGEPMTAHSTAEVPLIVGPATLGVAGLDDGGLADVAPTLLTLLGLAQPAVMTGRDLIRRAPGVAGPTLVDHAASS
jgi:2,3-bisphosphoglycerate-independent phosphoglycerate mutase